ncbi:hypothetical protein CYG48_09805 [Neorhizobium sp. SOG26]|jgi:hypothetical protein|uniref:hypothetical protein n=1 Tax=Neorhizobium sp. SOG26 TaxID=2060726 RepID=UPI000E58BE9D|nr:hypothetical protein [Neorhizobium sp. SOG26]AXV15964.1 hypothetical protein CYG48_09805 [Neorhizobium sp. SOG26]
MRLVLTGSMVAFACLFSTAALAHEAHSAGGMAWKYDGFCCNGDNHTGDCQMISTRNVKVTENGYEIQLKPGDHRMITRPHRFTMKQSQARRSQDEEYHICLYPTEDNLRCFYAPDMSF